MRKILPFTILSLLIILAFQSCESDNKKEVLTKEIRVLEDTLKANETKKINKTLANDLIEKSVTYAEFFPNDELTPAYLFRAGNVAVGIGSFDEAVKLFETVYDKYPDFKRAPDALFLEGFTYENHMNDVENAKRCYNDFLKRFPDNQLADQVRVVLENIGKSPEELVKGFQKK